MNSSQSPVPVADPPSTIGRQTAEGLAAVEPSAPKKQTGEAPMAPTPVARRANEPRKSKKLPLFAAAGVLVLTAAFVIIKITNKDGSVTELKVPDGSKVEVVENGKTTVVVDPKAKKDPIAKVEPKKVDPPPFVPPTFDEKEAKKQQEEWSAKLKLPVEATNKIGMKMILIPPAGAALPKPYYLGKYEVTQSEWTQVMGFNPSAFDPKKAKVADTSNFPVEQVSWFDSVEFCNKLSEQGGLQPYYDLKVTKRVGKDSKQIEDAEVKILGGSGYHIPTDAEWTWGCAAGTKTKYHFGDKDEDLLEYARFKDNSDGRTHTVGEKRSNAFGLHDTHGNVMEWNEEMLSNAKTGAPMRVVRGGDWHSTAGPCTVSARHRHSPATRSNIFGLRLARIP
jgi:formylglycine-generating enzyme